MRDKLFSDFKNLGIDDKKSALLDELLDNIKTVETLCMKHGIKYEKLRKEDLMVDKNLLTDDDFLYLLYKYNLVIRENSANLLLKLLK